MKRITENEYMEKLEAIRNQYRAIYAQRKGSLVFDGIVNCEKYEHILLLLKEANQAGDPYGEAKPLNELLNENEPWQLWLRVAEWIWGISNADQNHHLPYSSLEKLDYAARQREIQKIAVINLNKADGIGTPDRADLEGRLQTAIHTHPELLKAEIEAVQPRIIICGNTYEYLQELYHLDACNGYKDFTIAKIGNDENVMIINACHPNAHIKSLMAYYGIVGIYQEALSEGWKWE